ERDRVHGHSRGVHPARDGPPRGQAVRRLPLRPQARAHSQEARQGAQRARRRARPSDRRQRAPRVLTLRVAFAGTPRFALPALEALAAAHEVVGVLTQPDRPQGRGRKLTPSAVKSAALARALPCAQPATLREPSAQEQLAARQPQALAVVAYGLVLPQPVLRLRCYGCLNIHASLLPRWRGAAPIPRAILAGDTETGVSIMQMDAGLDTGPVLTTRHTVISSAHTAGTLA